MIKKILYLLIAVFIVIQFFHRDKNTNNSPEAHANDITKVIPIPDSVLSILQTSCYDCHSNNTDYPWYAEIQPAAWWLNHHIEEGKKEINFNLKSVNHSYKCIFILSGSHYPFNIFYINLHSLFFK